MTQTLLVVTDAYQLAAAAPAVFTIKNAGKGNLLFNDTDVDDDTAHKFTRGDQGKQVEQRSTTNTYVRATEVDAGWEIIIDA